MMRAEDDQPVQRSLAREGLCSATTRNRRVGRSGAPTWILQVFLNRIPPSFRWATTSSEVTSWSIPLRTQDKVDFLGV